MEHSSEINLLCDFDVVGLPFAFPSHYERRTGLSLPGLMRFWLPRFSWGEAHLQSGCVVRRGHEFKNAAVHFRGAGTVAGAGVGVARGAAICARKWRIA